MYIYIYIYIHICLNRFLKKKWNKIIIYYYFNGTQQGYVMKKMVQFNFDNWTVIRF
jgi:hypothetical protein